MKIGLFTSIEGWGGSEIYLLTLMEGLRVAGHEPVLYGVEGTRLYEECRVCGIQRVAWKAVCEATEVAGRTKERADPGKSKILAHGIRSLIPVSVRLLLGNIKEVRRLVRLFRQNPCDLMHVSVNGYELAGLACRSIGIPCLAWHCIMPVQDRLWIRRWLIWWTNRHYDKIGGMSKTCVDAWLKWCRLDEARCCWAWNGIDVNRFRTETNSRRLDGKPFVILAIGRLHPMKGFNLLIRALSNLKDKEVVLRIAGEGAQDKELQSLAANLGEDERVEFLGHQDDVHSLYRHASCFVLPSVSHESFGIVLAEAMASGLPIITSDFGPLPEINIDGETGIVVAAGDSTALARAIRYLVDHPDKSKKFGRNGVKRAIECFSRERMVESMLRIYLELVKAK